MMNCISRWLMIKQKEKLPFPRAFFWEKMGKHFLYNNSIMSSYSMANMHANIYLSIRNILRCNCFYLQALHSANIRETQTGPCHDSNTSQYFNYYYCWTQSTPMVDMVEIWSDIQLLQRNTKCSIYISDLLR